MTIIFFFSCKRSAFGSFAIRETLPHSLGQFRLMSAQQSFPRAQAELLGTPISLSLLQDWSQISLAFPSVSQDPSSVTPTVGDTL